MGLKLIQRPSTQCLSLPAVKAYLRISHDLEDEWLRQLIDQATSWVEESTGKTIIPKTWQYTHTNNRVFLPNPPVIKILDVKLRGKTVEEGDYHVESLNGRTFIVLPFSWKKCKITVTYETGYGNHFSDIPPTLQQAVLTTLAYLYENRSGNLLDKKHITGSPWIEYHKTYHLS